MNSTDHKLHVDNTKIKILDLLNSVKRQGMSNLIEYLLTTDFFTAPASTTYHSAVYGGLCIHSMHVYEILQNYCNLFNINFEKDTLIISALLHDVCKINFYKVETKWRKPTGKWESYYGYTASNAALPTGHGAKSVIMLQNFIKLKNEELLAIYWHMGLPVEYTDRLDYDEARKKSKLVTLLHLADLSASMLLEEQELQEHLIVL